MENELDRLTNAKPHILNSYSILDEMAFMTLMIDREIASLGEATVELSRLKYQLSLMERHLEELSNRIPWIGIDFVDLVHEQELFDAAYQIASEEHKLTFEAIKAEVLPLTMDWQDRIFDDFKRLFPASSDENLRAFGFISRDKIDLQIEIVHLLRFFTLFNKVFSNIHKSPSEAFFAEADLALLSQFASDQQLQAQQKALSLISKPLEDLSDLKIRFIKSYEQILSTDCINPLNLF